MYWMQADYAKEAANWERIELLSTHHHGYVIEITEPRAMLGVA